MRNIIFEIINSLKHLSGINVWITIFLLIIVFISVLSMCLYCLILFLDGTYRPNTPQFPYNIIADRILPILFISSPIMLILYLNPDNITWFEKFSYMLILHCFLLIPIMYFWSKQRNWYSDNEKISYKKWSSPRIYLDFVIAIVYPTFWGFYLHVVRYLHLGNVLDITKYINYTTTNMIILSVFLGPFIYLWVVIIIRLFIQIKTFLWTTFSNFMISIILFLLRYKIIFFFLEKIYQLSFFGITFIICDPYIYKTKSFIRKKIHLLYLHPSKIWVFIISIIILELCYTHGQLYYSIYMLALFLPIRAIMQLFYLIAKPTNNWAQLCCYSNYINYMWFKPYYEKKFWLSFDEMQQEFGHLPVLEIQEKTKLDHIIRLWEIKEDKTRNRNYYIFTRLIRNPRTGFIHRLRLTYRKWTKIL